MASEIFVTGGSGFVGSAVIDELLGRGCRMRALVHRRDLPARDGRVTSIKGGFSDVAALDAAIGGSDAVVHLVGIIAENPSAGVTFQKVHVDGTAAVVAAANRAGVRRYVHMSALGTRPDAASDYHKTKHAAEQIVRESGLGWTIFRPALIHGADGEFAKMEARFARGQTAPYLFMPYFGGGILGRRGAGLLQPVYVGDVARAFADALDKPRTIGRTYDLAGPDRMSWPDMHRAFSRAVTGREKRTLAVPAWYARLLAATLPRSLLPFNRDQVIMSQEDNTGDIGPLAADFGWSPQTLEASLASYAGRL